MVKFPVVMPVIVLSLLGFAEFAIWAAIVRVLANRTRRRHAEPCRQSGPRGQCHTASFTPLTFTSILH
jgi:hypothetical protein